MRDFVSLFVNGNPARVDGESAFMTLSEFLRQKLRLTGTKVVCSEGDCGACSVLVGRPAGDIETFQYQCIDSCIVFMHQLDRAHVVSVEGLSEPIHSKLSEVQSAMVACHGSQCGFCTPGFVVAMHGLCEENFDPATEPATHHLDEETLRLGLSGNLCRCTGYVQIMDAAKSIDASALSRMNDIYPSEPMAKAFASLGDDFVQIDSGERLLFLPRTLEQAVAMKAQHAEARVVAGATDVGVWYNHGRPSADVSIGLGDVKSLKKVTVEPEEFVIGAGVSWAQLIEDLECDHPEFVSILKRFGSPQIRNLGTIGGNLINASPIADSIPFLMAMGAKLTLVGERGTRTVPINEFYLGYKEIDLAQDELLESISLPKRDANQVLRLYKVSRRQDMDISTFTAAILLSLESNTTDQRVITGARIALGGVGPVVLRAKLAEQFVTGRELAIDVMSEAGRIARTEVSAITDVRGSDEYRQQLAENIFVKCFHDLDELLQANAGAV